MKESYGIEKVIQGVETDCKQKKNDTSKLFYPQVVYDLLDFYFRRGW